MKPSIDRGAVLSRLVDNLPEKQLTEAAAVVVQHRGLIRKAMRLGYSLETLSIELKLPKRTLQRHLNLAGLFFRKPRVNKGVVVRAYKSKNK